MVQTFHNLIQSVLHKKPIPISSKFKENVTRYNIKTFKNNNKTLASKVQTESIGCQFTKNTDSGSYLLKTEIELWSPS